MGRGSESNIGRPELRAHNGTVLLFPSWGSERVAGVGFGHVAAQRPGSGVPSPGEGVTKAEWKAITAAAVQGVQQMEAAIAVTPLSSAYQRAVFRAVANGVQDLPQRTQAAYAAWDGASLASPWVTA